jgi:hypothetical protein
LGLATCEILLRSFFPAFHLLAAEQGVAVPAHAVRNYPHSAQEFDLFRSQLSLHNHVPQFLTGAIFEANEGK